MIKLTATGLPFASTCHRVANFCAKFAATELRAPKVGFLCEIHGLPVEEFTAWREDHASRAPAGGWSQNWGFTIGEWAIDSHAKKMEEEEIEWDFSISPELAKASAAE